MTATLRFALQLQTPSLQCSLFLKKDPLIATCNNTVFS